MSANPAERYQKLVEMLKDPGISASETENIRARLRELEREHPGLRGAKAGTTPPNPAADLFMDLIAKPVIQAVGETASDFIRDLNKEPAMDKKKRERRSERRKKDDGQGEQLRRLRKLVNHSTQMIAFLEDTLISDEDAEDVADQVEAALDKLDPAGDVRWDSINEVMAALGKAPLNEEEATITVTVRLPLIAVFPFDAPGSRVVEEVVGGLILGAVQAVFFPDGEEGEEEDDEDAEDEDSD